MTPQGRLSILKESLKLKKWQRKVYYKCPQVYCYGEHRIIVSVGTKSNDRVLFCPKCGIWSETRLDWNGAISSEKVLQYYGAPENWVKRMVAYHVGDWTDTIKNRHARIAEIEAEIAKEEEDLSTIDVIKDDWYTLANV